MIHLLMTLSGPPGGGGINFEGLVEFIREIGRGASDILQALLGAYPAIGAIALILGLLGGVLNKRSLIYIALFFGGLSLLIGAAPNLVQWFVDIGKTIFQSVGV